MIVFLTLSFSPSSFHVLLLHQKAEVVWGDNEDGLFGGSIYSTILTKRTNSCQKYGIVLACAGVCRAYRIVHLKCTRKSSKMLCEGISVDLSFLQFQIIICSLIFLSFFGIILSFGYINTDFGTFVLSPPF